MLIFSPVYRLSWVRHTFQLQYRLSTPFPYVARKPRGAENLTRHIVPYRPLSLTHSPLFDRAPRRRPASDDFAHTTKGPRYVSTSHIYAARATRPPHPSPARIPTAPQRPRHPTTTALPLQLPSHVRASLVQMRTRHPSSPTGTSTRPHAHDMQPGTAPETTACHSASRG